MENNRYDMTISHASKEFNEGLNHYMTHEYEGIDGKKYSEKEIEQGRQFFSLVAMTYHRNPSKIYLDELLKEKNIYVTVEYQSAPNGNHKLPKEWNRYRVYKNEICVFDAEDNAYPRKINNFTIGTWEEEFIDCIQQAKKEQKQPEFHYTLRLK